MEIQTIIVEDDLMAQTALTRFCEITPELLLKSTCSNGREAFDYLSNNEVDLILLDVEMPDINGLELLDKLAYLPQIIMTTGNTEYAYEAFEYNVTDFLKKPISQARFQKAIQKVIDFHERVQQSALSSASKEIYIKSDGKLIRLEYDNILYFENVGDYVKVICEESSHVIYGALKAIDHRLSHPRFLKVHRSFIVNLDKIVDIQDNSIVIAKKVIPISRAHKSLLINSLNVL